MADVVVEREVAAPPDAVWAVVADPAAIARQSPELHHVRWLSDERGPGARFRGHNRRKGVFRWSTTATVTEVRPGERFAYDVSLLGQPVATWAFELEPTASGTKVRQRFTDRRNGLLKLVGAVGTGVTDRAAHNRAGMEATLAGVAEVVRATR